MDRFAVALLADKRSQVLAVEDHDWQSLARLLTEHAVGEKDGPAVMLAEIEPGPRLGERVTARNAVELDVEARTERVEGSDIKRVTGPFPPPLRAIAERLQGAGIAAVLATTYSHEAPAYGGGTLGPRYRIVIKSSRPLAPAELRPVAEYVARALGLAECVDSACMEPARLFYLPRTPSDRAPLADRATVEGTALDVDAVLRQCAPAQTIAPDRSEPPPPNWAALPEAERQRIVLEVRDALRHIPSDDHGIWVAIGQNLHAMGEEGRALWVEWSRTSSKWQDGDERQWRGFKGDRSDWRAVFTKAAALGWINPRRDPEAIFGGLTTPLPPGAALEPVAPFREVALSGTEPEPMPPWWVEGYMPQGQVTMLGGHGGAGKSTLAIMAAAAVATGLPFMGCATRAGRVLIFSAEDPGSLVRLRVTRACRELGVEPAAVAGQLLVLDATEGAPVLYAEQRIGGVRSGVLTPTYHALARYVAERAVDVVIIDNASDAFDADEINRASVRSFLRALALLVRPRGGAVLLLAHVDKSTSRAGKGAGTESYSGSTAWHNSVRSRLFFVETGPGLYELRHEKSNLGPRREPLTLTWPQGGLPRPLEAFTPAGPDADLRALLALLDEYAQRGEHPSTSLQGRPTVAALVGHERTYPRHLKPAEVLDLLRDAERRGLLFREQYRKTNRQPGERFALTDSGRFFAGTALSAPSVPSCHSEHSRPVLGVLAPSAGGCGGSERAHTEHLQALPAGVVPPLKADHSEQAAPLTA